MAHHILSLSSRYFALVFAVGWILGPIRELWVIPRFGSTAGHLMEAPLMILATILAARWTVEKSPPELSVRAGIGLAAFSMLVAAELLGVFFVRRLSLSQYFASFNFATGTATVAAYLLFAALPVLLKPRVEWRAPQGRISPPPRRKEA